MKYYDGETKIDHSYISDYVNNPPLETASLEHLKSIDKNVSNIDFRFETESNERKIGDVENRKYSSKWNKITLTISVFSLLIGVAGVAIALIALLS